MVIKLLLAEILNCESDCSSRLPSDIICKLSADILTVADMISKIDEVKDIFSNCKKWASFPTPLKLIDLLIVPPKLTVEPSIDKPFVNSNPKSVFSLNKISLSLVDSKTPPDSVEPPIKIESNTTMEPVECITESPR